MVLCWRADPFKPECKVGATTLQKIVVELDYQGSFVPFKIDIIESFKSNDPVLCTIGRIEVPSNTQYKYNVSDLGSYQHISGHTHIDTASCTKGCIRLDTHVTDTHGLRSSLGSTCSLTLS